MRMLVAYNGDKCLGCFLSYEDMARTLGYTVGTLRFRATKSGKKRIKGDGLTVEVVDDEEMPA